MGERPGTQPYRSGPPHHVHPSTHCVRRTSRISPPMSSGYRNTIIRSLEAEKPEHLRTDHESRRRSGRESSMQWIDTPAAGLRVREADGAKKRIFKRFAKALTNTSTWPAKQSIYCLRSGGQDRWRKWRNSGEKPKSMPCRQRRTEGDASEPQPRIGCSKPWRMSPKTCARQEPKPLYPRVIGSWAGASLLRC